MQHRKAEVENESEAWEENKAAGPAYGDSSREKQCCLEIRWSSLADSSSVQYNVRTEQAGDWRDWWGQDTSNKHCGQQLGAKPGRRLQQRPTIGLCMAVSNAITDVRSVLESGTRVSVSMEQHVRERRQRATVREGFECVFLFRGG